MSKVYDATKEFKPFERPALSEGVKRHPNKGKKKKLVPATPK